METKTVKDFKEQRTHRYRNIIHLWEFLLELLADERCLSIINWSRKEQGEFKLKNAAEVAKKWGAFKHKSDMTYDKLSRALRCYYRQGIIKKVPGQRLVYKFDKLPYEYKPRIQKIRLALEKQEQLLAEKKRVSDVQITHSLPLSFLPPTLPITSVPPPPLPFLPEVQYFGDFRDYQQQSSYLQSWHEVTQAQASNRSYVMLPRLALPYYGAIGLPRTSSLAPYYAQDAVSAILKCRKSIPVSVIRSSS